MSISLISGDKNSSNGNRNTVELLFFIALNLLVIPFSAYQTYVGYSEDVVDHWAAAATIAGISGVLFAAMNFGIRQRRLDGKKHFWQVMLYVLPLGLSFFGNFNAFYSTQMRNQLYDSEVSNYQGVLTKTKDQAIATLNASTGIATLQSALDQRQQALQDQFDGTAGAAGWETNAEKEWVKLKALIEQNGGTITNLMKKDAKTAIELSDNSFRELKRNRETQIKPIVEFADSTFKQLEEDIDAAKKYGTINQVGRELLDGIVKTNNQIGAKTKSHVADFEFEELSPSDHNQIGTIKHSLTSAFITKDNPTATYFSLFLSLIIDLSALLYILLFIPYNKQRGKSRIGNSPNVI
jgi:hypothetical protein